MQASLMKPCPWPKGPETQHHEQPANSKRLADDED